MPKKIKVAQFGMGPIGRACIQLLAERSGMEIVGAVDIDPALTGKSVAELCGLTEVEAGRVYATFEELWNEAQPDAILHTAGSRAAISFAQCRPMLERGLAVVSSCEELLYPYFRAPEETAEYDARLLAAPAGVRLITEIPLTAPIDLAVEEEALA